MKVRIRIDTKRNQLNIHRKAVSAIGNPPFIKFGYTARTKELAVAGVWVDDLKSIRVRYNAGGSFYVCSKGLIEGIRAAGNVLKEQGSYLLDGEVTGTEIHFPLMGAHPLLKDESGPAETMQEGGQT